MKSKIKIIYLATISLSIFLQFGCNSLTERLWTDNPMVVSGIEINKSYLSNDNTGEIYVNLGVNRIAKIDIQKEKGEFANMITGKNMEDMKLLELHDLSKVDRELREMSYYDFIIFPVLHEYHDSAITTKSLLFSCKSELVDKMPDHIQSIKNPYLPRIDVYYWENNRSSWSIAWRCLASPFTFVADILLVPSCYTYRFIDFMMTPNLYQ